MLKLKELRVELGLTQREFANKIGLDAHNIGDWERGKCEPSIFWIEKIADVFNISIDYLLGREDDFGNVTVTSPATEELTYLEKKLLTAFSKLDPDEKEKILSDTEYFANKHTQNGAIRKPYGA